MCIVGYTVGNLVLRRRASRAVKRDFRTYIRRYTSPNKNFEYDYPHSNAVLQFCLKLEMKCDVINDVKRSPAVYRRIQCRKFLTSSNQISRYKSKCVRIVDAQSILALVYCKDVPENVAVSMRCECRNRCNISSVT